MWRWLDRSGLPDRERAVVLALLLGIRNELDAAQKDAFARSGTMHVLAVSGMHVALIYWVLMALLKPLGGGGVARWSRAVIALLVLWGYAGITGATPSVLRATVMCSLFVIAGLSERRSATLNTLAGSALLLLVWDPRMLFQLSFQLSFLAVLGIVLCYDPIRRLWSPGNVVLRYCWSLIAVSLAAQLFTTPVSLAVFKAFPVWFLPANIIIVTLVNIGSLVVCCSCLRCRYLSSVRSSPTPWAGWCCCWAEWAGSSRMHRSLIPMCVSPMSKGR
ncbi:MAG: ComEC/Rec2 family competence protein [Flavobacteriales bacterium]|nr:ComEC/Rec2 family competence protein [Flavobacteriales bacterium]